jgi:hypothetical protein
MIDTTEARSPGWWLQRLLTELGDRQPRFDLLDAWYRGEPPLPEVKVDDAARAALAFLQKKARANWAALIVEAVRERTKLLGFRIGESTSADKAAARILKANGLAGLGQQQLHRTKGSLGDAYVIVGSYDERIKAPRITVEDPRSVITAVDPIDRRETVAALKVICDDAGKDVAYVHVPGEVWIAERDHDKNARFYAFEAESWTWRTVDEEGNPAGQEAPTDGVSVFHFGNRIDTIGRTLGEFEDFIDDLERINLMLLQRINVAVMQAFRQRALKGHLPEKREDGTTIDYNELFSADPAALWQLPAGVELWESAGVDLTPILESVKADVRDLAGSSRTPMYYIFPTDSGSAEGAALQREGLVFKAGDRLTEASDPWEAVMHSAFEVASKVEGSDVEAVDRFELEAIWAPADRITVSERYAAAAAAKNAGVPWRTIMTDVLQFTPAQVDRMEQERKDDAQSPLASILGELDSANIAPTPPVAVDDFASGDA